MTEHVTVPESLRAFFAEYPRVALAFSGGVDSAYLLYAAAQSGVDVHAYYVKTPFQPAFEASDAQRLAHELNAKLTVLRYDVLQSEAVSANPPNRCYECKRLLFTQIETAARADGYPTLLDGTNASDDADDRPGMRALTELGVLSPLRLCGITKAQVRQFSKAAGLFTWDKPAYACLATRIPTGTPITQEALEAVERAEDALHALGFSALRVRKRGKLAKLQLPDSQMERLIARRMDVVSALAPDFDEIVLDLVPREEA